MIEKVNSYKASDGALFSSRAEAEIHQEGLDFDVWYQGNRLCGNYAGSSVDINCLKEWLYDNAAKVRFLLKG